MLDGMIPWDVQDDALRGLYLRDHPILAFSPSLKNTMNGLAEELGRLPEAALYPGTPYTKANCLAAMNHPAWVSPRIKAAGLLLALEPAIQRNRKALNLE